MMRALKMSRESVRACVGSALVALLGCAVVPGCGSAARDPFDQATDASVTPTGGDASGGGGTTGGPTDPGTFDDDAGTASADASRDSSLFSDASPDVGAADACVSGDAGPAPFPQRCTRATTNECDGVTDQDLASFGVGTALRNVVAGAGAQGNGFDDDCDGLVDEGCKCQGNGQTKDCYLVPATQANPATKQPAGWCQSNSKGSLDCAGTEFSAWSGTCRGAQPPYRHDVCATGDYNCDGVSSNSDIEDCACKTDPVTCPTGAIQTTPYPAPNALLKVDGSSWITDPAQRAAATNWTWTAIGGDCDNVLPYPTFALYNQAVSDPGARRGTRTPVLFDPNATPPRYVGNAAEKLIAMQAANYGIGVAGGQVYPAFGLSGDYLVQGEFDLSGKHYVCTQKVEVRAPGIRAELCWDTVGGALLTTPMAGNDIDLHFARLQGTTCANPGWDSTCAQTVSGKTSLADCYFSSSSGCPSGDPGWGYTSSANTACVGWSSPRTGGCTNPRLDKDNVTCDPSVQDPTVPGFCGPENINIDNPKDGDRFVVGVNHYGNHGGTSDAKPHVNVYCNGRRVLSAGYNPATGQTAFPLMKQGGSDTSGDYWIAARVKANVTGGQLTSCDIDTIPSHKVDTTRDGLAAAGSTGNGTCVDSHTSSTSPAGKFEYTNHRFMENTALQTGTAGIPNTPADWCKH